MLKSLRPFALALVAAAVMPLSSAMAQGEFTPGSKILNLGLFLDGGTGFGGSFEASVKELAPNIRLGIGGQVGYYSESNFGIDVSSIPVHALANVHLAVPSVPQLDLFAGLAVGVIRTSVSGGLGDILGEDASTTDFGAGVNIGARYFFTPKLAGMAQLGVGDVPELFLGVTIGF
jgi:hypothetical protein